MLVSANAALNARIADFVAAADEISAEYIRRNGYSQKPSTHRADYISDKWVRVVTIDHYENFPSRDSSVYAFICLKDGQTKTLGQLFEGDIHKPASFKAPAKVARGNVFKDDFRSALTPHGIVYLRG